MKDKILKQLEEQKLNAKAGYRIYFGGDLLIMNSGKFVWGQQGHARNALIRSLKDTILEFRSFEHEVNNLHTELEKLINSGTIKIEYR